MFVLGLFVFSTRQIEGIKPSFFLYLGILTISAYMFFFPKLEKEVIVNDLHCFQIYYMEFIRDGITKI